VICPPNLNYPVPPGAALILSELQNKEIGLNPYAKYGPTGENPQKSLHLFDY